MVEKREALKTWTVLLAIGTFSLSLSGTFLVRSGILNSVHAFANDPARGVFILALLALVIGGSLLLFAFRAPALAASGLFAPISREGALVLNNILLCSIAAVVLTGHDLSAVRRAAVRRQDQRRRAVLQRRPCCRCARRCSWRWRSVRCCRGSAPHSARR